MQKPPNTVAYYYFTKQNTVMERGKYCYLNDFFNFVGEIMHKKPKQCNQR